MGDAVGRAAGRQWIMMIQFELLEADLKIYGRRAVETRGEQTDETSDNLSASCPSSPIPAPGPASALAALVIGGRPPISRSAAYRAGASRRPWPGLARALATGH